MNGIELFFNHIPRALPNTETTESTGDEQPGFRQLLSTKIATAQSLTTHADISVVEETNRKNQLNMLMNFNQNHLNDLLIDDDVVDELSHVLSADNENHGSIPEEVLKYFEDLFGDTLAADELLERLNELGDDSEVLGDHITIQDIMTVLAPVLIEDDMPIDEELATQQTDGIDEQVIVQQFTQLLNQIQARLIDFTSDPNRQQKTQQVVALIERWVTLEQTVRDSNTSLQSLLSQLEVDEEELDIWNDVLQSFQKRHSMTGDQQQKSDVLTEHKVIHTWLADVLPALSQQNTTHHAVQQTTSMTQIPLSELEQYVIHMNQSQGTQTAGKQLMDQFQQIIKSSRFLANNGMNQLSVSLRPQNMGDMMVRLTQMDGEMTVKIIVSSSMTRHMLESNIQELRHMFSPHQVVIEEQDIESQEIQKEFHDETAYGDEEHQEHQQHDDSKEHNDFETTFLELLMNEKV